MVRETNFCSPLENQAAIFITSTQYDKRALSCSDPLALTNSLVNLNYQTSVATIRTAYMLSCDGGLEMLVSILRDVRLKGDNLSRFSYTAALSCLSNVAVRGNQRLRKRLVEAGVVPIIIQLLLRVVRVLDIINSSGSSLQGLLPSSSDQQSEGAPTFSRAFSALNNNIMMNMQGAIRATQIAETQQAEMTEEPISNNISSRLELPPIAPAAERELRFTVSDVDIEAASSLNQMNNIQIIEPEERRSIDFATDSRLQQQSGSSPIPHRNLQIQSSLEIPSSSSSSVSGRSSSPNTASTSTNSTERRTTSNHLSVNDQSNLAQRELPSPYSPLSPTSIPHTEAFHPTHQQTPRVPQVNPSPQPTRPHNSTTQFSSIDEDLINDVLYRTDDILLAIKIIAYLSKYPTIRPELHTGFSRNVFELIEVFTAPSNLFEIRRWAITCMRNAFKRDNTPKDDSEMDMDKDLRSLRTCGNLRCGKIEDEPRQFSKCSRCRRVAYCSKSCQRHSWPLHKNWCLRYEGCSGSGSTNEQLVAETSETTIRTFEVQRILRQHRHHIPNRQMEQNAQNLTNGLESVTLGESDGFERQEQMIVDIEQNREEPFGQFSRLSGDRELMDRVSGEGLEIDEI